MEPIDINKVLAAKIPKIYPFIPHMLVERLRKLIHEQEMNHIITQFGNQPPMEFIRSCFGYMGISYTAGNLDSLDPAGRYLFASNRGFDSIAVFRLDGKGGMERTSLVLSGGSSPRDINFLPGGKMFAAANEFSDVLVFFDYDGEGGLTPNGLIYKLPRPLCVMWR